MGCGSSKVNNPEETNGKKLNHNGEPIPEKEVITKEEDIKIFHNNLVQHNKGSIKDNYKIQEKIGSGAFGKVYKVLHRRTQQTRAMKVVKIDTINYQDDDKRFLKEIEMLSQLDHPNIIKIYEYYSDDLHYYVITEIARGGELYEEIFKSGQLTEKDAAEIMKQLLSVVCYIHSRGILHRDLKPENILLETRKKNRTEMNIKIIDFGNSNYFDKSTKLSLRVGTPYYMAPEVLKSNYDNKCDIWSCGVIMYVILSGAPPFDGSDDHAITELVKRGKYNFDGEEWDIISDDAKNLISKMLTYDPKERIPAEECLKHPWIVENLKGSLKANKMKINSEAFTQPFENLRKFNAKQKLQQATIAFLVHHASSTDMVKDLRNIFKIIDKDGDGTLSYEEIKEGFKEYYKDENIAEKEVEEIIKKIDLDNNQCIEYEEFIRCTVNMDLLLTEENLKMVFNAFDKDNSGNLTHDEIKMALGLIETDDKDLIKNIISEIDVNGDGDISFEEFKELMLKVMQSG